MDGEAIKEFFHDQQILDDIIAKLNQQRNHGKNCDYTLKTEDGGSFKTHKNVLESVSPFFEKMFNFESIDKEKDSVLLKGCSSDVLEKIIEFMYTGEVEITSDIAKETLDTAYFLQLNTLVDYCTQVLIKTANSENCFDLLAYSETYFNGEPLAKKCAEIIGENIDTLKNSSEFAQISLDSMKTLCSCDRSFCNDEQLYLAIVKWVKFDMENREKYIAVLLDQIKFEGKSLEFGVKEILEHNSLWKNQDYISKIMGVLSENWTQQLTHNKNQKIVPRFNPNNLYAVVGDKIVLYDPETKLFSRVIRELNDNRTDFGYSTFGDKNFVVCGGQVDGRTSNDCCYFSLQENCWKSLPSMEISRSRLGAITLNEKIYVCGGLCEKTVEIFDINKSNWTRGPSFEHNVSWIGLCLYNENVYGVHESKLQFLDTRIDKWIELPSLSQRTQGMHSAISYNDYIYGFDRDRIFTFDIRANKWLEDVTIYERSLSYHIDPRSCMINNEIYVFEKLKKNEKFMLNSYKASNLSENVSHIMKLEWKNVNCKALFSL